MDFWTQNQQNRVTFNSLELCVGDLSFKGTFALIPFLFSNIIIAMQRVFFFAVVQFFHFIYTLTHIHCKFNIPYLYNIEDLYLYYKQARDLYLLIAKHFFIFHFEDELCIPTSPPHHSIRLLCPTCICTSNIL